MFSNIISLIIHTFVAISLVDKNFEIEGIAIAMCINYIVRFISLQLLIVYSPYQKNLISLLDRTSWKNLKNQLRLGLISVFMGIWQYWSYQMYSVIAMLFMAANVIAAQHISINIVSIFHVLPIALSMAFSVFVGNMIGAKRTREAREYVKLSVITGTIWGIVSGSIMILFK
jgi:multidrug resistance protein, MATE family